jgi:antitoxin component of MazEF toxin-antitoxin module
MVAGCNHAKWRGVSCKRKSVNGAIATLVLRPIEKEYTLEEFGARITPENVHEETDWSPPLGREVW